MTSNLHGIDVELEGAEGEVVDLCYTRIVGSAQLNQSLAPPPPKVVCTGCKVHSSKRMHASLPGPDCVPVGDA